MVFSLLQSPGPTQVFFGVSGHLLGKTQALYPAPEAILASVYDGCQVDIDTGLRMEHGPRIGDGARLAFAFSGAFIAAFGAKIAKGCTSGQALSGGALLNSGSLIFMLAVFVAAYPLAWLVRKEWI